MTIELPTTAEVLVEIRTAGVVVGSWPRKRDDAKDLDVVIKPRGLEEGRNPVFERMRKFGAAFESSAPGHAFIKAVPMNVEVFEGKSWRVDDPAKHAGMLTYHQARRRSSWVDCYGVLMRAVI